MPLITLTGWFRESDSRERPAPHSPATTKQAEETQEEIMSLDMYNCTPKLAREAIIDCIQAGLVPMLKGSPGTGKSAGVHAIGEDFNLHLIDHRISTSTPVDFTGLPRFDADGKARFSPFADIFPTEDMTPPEGKDGWLLFLDEFNSGEEDVQAAAYKLVLDRKVGQYKLHPKVAIVLAGNLATDKAIVKNLSTAMQSRIVHLKLELDFNEFMRDVAIPQKWDPRVIAYLNYKPKMLFDFKPDHNDETFCCPRTWDFLQRMIKDKQVEDRKTPQYGGTITSGVAVDFVQFTKVYSSVIKIADVVRNPQAAAIPHDSSARWATISHLASQVTDADLAPVAEYADRYEMSFRILFYRMLMMQHPTLRSNPVFARSMVELSRYLND